MWISPSENRPRSPHLSYGGRFIALALGAVAFAGCSSDPGTEQAPRPTIVVTHAILGAVTSEIAGPAADVVVLIPNGVDPHLFEPSAKDIERLNSADLIVVNGLGLEEQLEDSVDSARAKKIPVFVATDHIEEHGADKPAAHSDEADHTEEAGHTDATDHGDSQEHEGHQHAEGDPHFWTDPRLMADVVTELGDAISDLGLDIGDRALMFAEQLLTFDQEMLRRVETLPVERRILVTGHESLGYFAERYGFDIVGTIIPGSTSAAEVSAGNLAEVKAAVVESGVDVIFTELGVSSASAQVLSNELDVDVVEISTHLITDEALGLGGAGETYIEFIDMLVDAIVTALEE